MKNRRQDNEIQPYLKETLCPSCGSADVDTRFCEGGCGKHNGRPLQHRQCLVCGNTFDQLPRSERRVAERRTHPRRDDNGNWLDTLKKEK